MHGAFPGILRFALLTGLYYAGAAVTVLFLRTPSDVVLFWPAAGIGLAFVLRYGLRYAFAVPLGQLLLHLTFNPVPTLFIPYSLGADFIAVVLAWLYVHSRKAHLQFRIQDGLLLLRGGLAMSLLSAGIGTLGMLHAGMVPPEAMPRAFLQWSLSNLLGITATTPNFLLLFGMGNRLYRPDAGNAIRIRLRERVLWTALMILVLAGGIWLIDKGSMYPLAISVLPLALLLWSAARFPPQFTAFSTMGVTLLMALTLGLGLWGLPRPETLHDTSMMMGSLVVNSVIPMLMAVAFRERTLAAEALRIRATQDPLTDLLNRFAFEERARARLAKNEPHLCLVYIDLDNFKMINESASHAAGDEMLRHIAALVRAEFTDNDLIAHSSGDEFTVLTAGDAPTTSVRCNRLLASIEATRVAWQGQNLGTSASIGIATSQPPHVAYDELLSQADTACHEAKEQGGNRLFLTESNAESLELRTRQMRSALIAREVLDEGRFELWCQPIINLQTPQPAQSHFELLMRWRDRDGQVRPPAELIAAAERYQLGPRLDRSILGSLLAWVEQHPEAAAGIQQCNLNLGAATLADEDFGNYLAHRLRRSALRADQVCVEITETSVVRDMTRTRRFIAQMRDLGCRFALDDFGTGFCSFSYLRNLQVDYLKIDGSFVRGIDQPGLSEAVVRSITEIAHLLDMRAVGEQVETEQQLDLLRRIGVDYAQGYYFQRPQPIAEFFAVTA